MIPFPPEGGPLLIAGATPVALGVPQRPIDILIGTDGAILRSGEGIAAPEGARTIDATGHYVSPGWVDLHTHVWYGGTDISIRPALAGLERGVTTLVDAGSAGEANFHGFREYVIEPARERIRAFLNVGSIGLVACNRVSELIDMRSIDLDRTIAVVEGNRDVIVGIKVRASGVIVGGWGITPVRIAKKLARITRLPLMVHVGEPPPLFDEVLDVLDPGDVVTHCFNGKAGGSIVEDDTLFALAQRCAAEGVRLDVGHGGASFSFRTARIAIERGLLPFSISTDLHNRSIDSPVWDMGTTMSKLLAVGMPFDKVIEASTLAPMGVIGLPTHELLAPGRTAEFTLSSLEASDLRIRDSMSDEAVISTMITPRHAVLGATAVKASPYRPHVTTAGPNPCPNCGWTLRR